jgi:5-methylcytosine-specific restriction endonuclease McrA
MPADPRDSGRWRSLRAQLRRAATVCAICGGPLDHNAKPRSRFYPSIDHIVPLSQGGDPFDQANLRVAHYGCNASRGAGLSTRQPPLRRWNSRRW